MISDREQAISIRRQVHTNHISFFVDYKIDEPGVLMSKSVVVLPPHMRGKQIVQRRDGTPPFYVTRDFQPLSVLVEHRIDDVNESFVTGKETVTAGEQVS